MSILNAHLFCYIYNMVELNKIYCEDCIEFLNRLDDNSLDCIITSPPYNFGKDYTEYDDKVDFKVYEDWLSQIFELCAKKLKEGGRMFVNVQPVFSENFPTHHVEAKYCKTVVLLGVVRYCGRRITTIVHILLGGLGALHLCLI